MVGAYTPSTPEHGPEFKPNANTIVVKPYEGLGYKEDPLRQNIPADADLENERATYLINRAMGNYVDMPVSVIQGEGEGRALVYNFKEGIVGAKWAKDHYDLSTLNQKDVDRIALLDSIIGNEDRHSGNYVIQDKHVVAIDHTLSFPTGPDDSPDSNNMGSWRWGQHREALQPEEKALLNSLVTQKPWVENELVRLVGHDSIDRMYYRVDKMLKSGKILRDSTEY
jgi:hypothetical protein